MEKKTAKKAGGNKMGTGMGIVAAVGAAAGAAAAGYYFYGSAEGKKHRKVAAKWASSMKADVIKQAKALKQADRKAIESIIAGAQKTYAGLKNMDRSQVEMAARELKSNWENIMKEAGKDASAAKKTVAKSVKTAKKAVKKAVKKVSN